MFSVDMNESALWYALSGAFLVVRLRAFIDQATKTRAPRGSEGHSIKKRHRIHVYFLEVRRNCISPRLPADAVITRIIQV